MSSIHVRPFLHPETGTCATALFINGILLHQVGTCSGTQLEQRKHLFYMLFYEMFHCSVWSHDT